MVKQQVVCVCRYAVHTLGANEGCECVICVLYLTETV